MNRMLLTGVFVSLPCIPILFCLSCHSPGKIRLSHLPGISLAHTQPLSTPRIQSSACFAISQVSTWYIIRLFHLPGLRSGHTWPLASVRPQQRACSAFLVLQNIVFSAVSQFKICLASLTSQTSMSSPLRGNFQSPSSWVTFCTQLPSTHSALFLPIQVCLTI